jgi:hypothetical protein
MRYDYDYWYTGGDYTGLPTIYWVLILAFAVYAIVAVWKVFEKAGKPGWAAIVPLYNTYTLFEITWGNGWYFLLMLLSIIPAVGSIAVLVILIITYVKLAKAFGKSGGFAAGLILLNAIFMGILAFDSSTYLGVPKKENSDVTPQPMQPVQPMEQPQPAQPTSYCSNCGASLPAGTAFCPNCGTQKTN